MPGSLASHEATPGAAALTGMLRVSLRFRQEHAVLGATRSDMFSAIGGLNLIGNVRRHEFWHSTGLAALA
jgi:hypothetical protein